MCIRDRLKPAGQPKIEPVDTGEGQDLKFVAIFEVYPDVKLPDFKKIIIEKPIADVEDKDIDQMVETLREQKKDWIDVSRKAKNKDLVNIDYLVLAVSNLYKESKDYEKIVSWLETIYTTNRIKFSLKGILLVGY